MSEKEAGAAGEGGVGRTAARAEGASLKSEGVSPAYDGRAQSDGAAGGQGGLLGEKGNDAKTQKDLKKKY